MGIRRSKGERKTKDHLKKDCNEREKQGGAEELECGQSGATEQNVLVGECDGLVHKTKIDQRFQVVSTRLQNNRYLYSKFDFYPQIKVISSVKCSKIMFFMGKVAYHLYQNSFTRPIICAIPVT